MRSIISSSGTSSPPSRIGLTSLPKGVPSEIAARSMSPVEMRASPYSSAMRFACVPLPDPWTPSNRTLSGTRLFQETLVGAHHHLRLHLAHGVERDTDRDQHGGAAERARRRRREAKVLDGNAG